MDVFTAVSSEQTGTDEPTYVLDLFIDESRTIKDLESNTGDVKDVCKCIVPLRHGGTLNSSRATSPFVRLVEGEEKWEALLTDPRVFLSKLGWKLVKTYWHPHGDQGYG
ncbi:hypothetical protein TNCV_1173281 [Trichonephila clavipes]|uniref:Uncharacterized protein n=1 Tax=Trichonephila clavipes TaxID=2585209 RepID=A0A8X6S2N1_TRICX|nr:hypothetical protein TNCV_1173281 [Trichonephila clavipes]